ncbi:sigma-54 dependent transcriptional regulator [Paraburkholderia sp. D15]|uniref:sigma-54-dependent transcriptional regulator n=1 Tax=Paraburkholderia sp. D15 TaxID=2880218 RepID=UPI00247B2B41|nr:sigma-54 dependent transcriptional regulator [Paraburkholderia sp. D15]WGS48081.1 sigma-54 dependent transcriptional regulator [Paraburkholderia sp. D15]WKF55949.1 Transcriptional regulatory protein ZraR [Paraburkholderia busanensis]
MPHILIVDDDATMRDALAEVVIDLGHTACLAADGLRALELLDTEPVSAMILDLRMPGIDGLEVLRRMRGRPGAPAVTVLTAHATASNTIEAMRLGAFDHLTKPIGRADLAQVLQRMLSSVAGPGASSPVAQADAIIGSSEAMRTVQKTIGVLADSDATVLITGETGTGKEVVARAIHEHGLRHERPFVAVNCAAIPGDLLESELFGHVRGAFTGANAERDGAFRQAAHGTLFLDEIGDMNIAMQAKILRALQERVVVPVGGKPVPVDVRVIAATHRDLLRCVREGTFREDLFYRLHVVPIHLPPLSARIADIVPLAEYFLTRAATGKRLSADAAALLIRFGWPGNVRELKNAMERAAVMVRGEYIHATDLAFLRDARSPQDPALEFDWPDEDLPSALARLEEMLIRRALRHSGNNRTDAARRLNVNRQLLYAKLKRYGIDEVEPGREGEAGSSNA